MKRGRESNTQRETMRAVRRERDTESKSLDHWQDLGERKVEKLKSRERDVEGVEVSRVYKEREKNLVQLIELNLVQQQPAEKKK